MKTILSLFLVLMCASITLATNRFSFIKYQVENGLSHNTIWYILQDRQGFMWFGTSDGLNRFDGRDFKIFRSIPQDSTSLGNNFVRSLFQDDQQNIWIGTNKGIYIFNPKTEQFRFFNCKTVDGALISSNVYDIKQSTNGDIWIATFGQGFFIFKPQTNTLIQNSRYAAYIKCLAPSPSGDMFLSSRQEGVIRFDSTGKYLQSYLPLSSSSDISDGEISALYFLNDTLWFSVGSSSLLNRVDLKNNKLQTFESQTSSNNITNIRSMVAYSGAELLIGADNGLYLFNKSTGKFNRMDDPSNPKSLSDQSIFCMTRDREGGIWISTNLGGVNYLPRDLKTFDHYFPLYQSGSISGKAISEFCEDPDGNIWIATEDGGLNWLNTKTNKIKSYLPGQKGNSISYHNIHALLWDNGKLWIGTFSRGLDILDLQTGKVSNYQHSRGNTRTISDNSIYAIYKDHQKYIYIGTAWGLNLYNPVTKDFSQISEVGGTSHVYDICEDSKSNLWIATYNTGLFRYHYPNQTWYHYNHTPGKPGSLTSNSILTIFEDSKNNIWFGTEGAGLCTFDYENETFTSFDPENQVLPNPVVYAIEEDKSGNLWIAGNAGLLCIHPVSRKWKLYTQADGLQSNQFNFHSSLHASNDKLYFGGINGFNSFYPEEFKENSYVPEVIITKFSLFNEEIKYTDPNSPLKAPISYATEIILNYNQNTFTLNFASLSYQAPGKNQYAYMLEGADKNWIYTGNKNEVTYTNLQPGDYIFRVKGSNNDGLWNPQDTSFKITIRPPFWKSVWAYGFYTILLLAAAGLALKFWSNQVKKKHQEILKEYRSQQEKETYQSKINFFTQVAHEIRTPLSLIKMPLESILLSGDGNNETRKYLTTMNKNTDRLLNLINQLLDFRKTETNEFKLRIRKHNLTEMLQNIILRFEPSAQLHHITLTTELPEIPYMACFDEEALTKVISNLLSNALKYAHSTIKLTLCPRDNDFEIRVSDDGPGIPRQERKRIFEIFYQSDNSKSGTGIGLALARLLTEKHSGKLSLDEQTAQGATFIIRIPILPETDETSPPLSEEITPEENNIGVQLVSGNGRSNILLTEDNIELLNLTAEQLGKYYRIHMATNGKEALEILAKENIDLVVSDIMMPEMDGYALCEAIKGSPQYCHIPVILLTAKTTTDDKIQGLEQGSDAYIEKPFSIQHLRSQIDNLLQSRLTLRRLFATSPLSAPETIAVAPKDKEFIEKLDEEIKKNIQEPMFSIDTLAEIMCMSRSNFYRKIKGISGMSPNDYLKTIRLKMAADLLVKQEFRINEIYELVGFSSSSYFTKCFKEQFGVPPKDYVNNLKNGQSTTNKNKA